MIGGRPLTAGLYLLATPIGAARDITLRALDILATADMLAAEDTRTLRHLMEIHGIPLNGRPLIAVHDHNETATSPRLLRAMTEGKSVAYASEAGTPMVSDPGFPLTRATIAAGLPVIVAPGPSAALCALTVSGLPSDRFLFAGFAPATAAARRSFLEELRDVDATLILYESPRRIKQLLKELCQTLGEMRQTAICRELTKRFEEITRGTLAEVSEAYADRNMKGEIVVLVDRGRAEKTNTNDWQEALDRALSQMSVKDAAGMVAKAYNLSRRDVYQVTLKRDKL